MSKQEIENYNRLCAEFLGYKLHFIDEEKTQPYLIHNDKYKVTGGTILLYKGAELKFHSDWNWIMEMVEAIEKIFHIQGVEINGKWCCIKTNTFHEYRGVNKKEAVVQAINKFLIWYNENP